MSPVATVTAASRGIGPATALVLAERRYRLVINYRSRTKQAEHVDGTKVTAARGEAVHDIDRAFRIIFAFSGSTTLTCRYTLPRCPSRNRVPWWSPAN
jgi:NAD(P)-dependent dehydrogenase (short-subunit alcohol dehydrogenase family)